MAKKRKRRRSRARRRPRFRARVFLFKLGLVAGLALSVYVLWLDHQISQRFEGRKWALPAVIHARSLELYAGRALGIDALQSELELLGYHQDRRLSRPGSFWRRGGAVSVRTRAVRFWDGEEPARRFKVVFKGAEIASLNDLDKGTDAVLVRLDPPVIGKIYPRHNEDRLLVRLEQVPPMLVNALLSVEDRGFYQHHGVAPLAILRALWVNLRQGRAAQGGSTLTQQLVKNYFLSRERTLPRKLQEAVMALLLEYRYSKQEILEAYINEIFLGQQGRRAIHGFGLAARFYFSRELQELQVHELATLVGLIRGPSHYDPRRHPERLLTRRNLILRLMNEQGHLPAAELERARARALSVKIQSALSGQRYPAYTDLVRRQLREQYRDEDLSSEGLHIHTMLDPSVQAAADRALSRRLQGLEQGKRRPRGSLQGAVVVVEPQSGEVLALVGDRQPRRAGFNRALDARRPVGSLLKPAVYLTALARPRRYHLLSLLRDEAVEVKTAEGIWRPANYDRKVHGQVPLLKALAHSYNLATVNLGLELGLDEVADTVHRLGIEQSFKIYPSMLLGAVEFSPMDISRLYQTLSAGGFQVPLRAIREVISADGEVLERRGLQGRQAFAPEPVYLLNLALRRALAEGTGRQVYKGLRARPDWAGKTGTTDELRDSWFAGFSAAHLAVVWVGRDDNGSTGLTGASGALRVWADLMGAIPTAQSLAPAPQELHWRWADVDRGYITSRWCEGSEHIPFMAASRPAEGECLR